jgi:deoxyribose-phosphate aldolase
MQILNQYPLPFTDKELANELSAIEAYAQTLASIEYYKLAFSLIDLTTLNSTDQVAKGIAMAQKVNQFQVHFAHMPNVAAICVYPPLVKGVRQTLTASGVGIASVGAGFPSSQTFLNVKLLECEQVVAHGATDVDIVISLGTWFDGNYQEVFDEIKAIKAAIGKAHLKVILETGALATIGHIWNASIVAMAAGADFIKTSTGKMEPASTPQAVYIMSRAIKAFEQQTGKQIAIKPAGGMVQAADALIYLAIIEKVLGADWLNPRMFRLGASRLANNLLNQIALLNGKPETITYF